MAKNTAPKQASTDGSAPKTRAPKGPELSWSETRDYALALAIAGGIHSTNDLATQLASDPAFANVEQGAITPAKVRLRLANLRKKGVAIPQFGRGRGYQVDVTGLNGLFGVSGGEQPSV